MAIVNFVMFLFLFFLLWRAKVGGVVERSIFWMPFVKGNVLRCEEWEGLVVGEGLEYSRITYPENSDGTYLRCDYQICPFPFSFLRPIIGFVRWLAVHKPDGREGGWEFLYRVRSTEYLRLVPYLTLCEVGLKAWRLASSRIYV